MLNIEIVDVRDAAPDAAREYPDAVIINQYQYTKDCMEEVQKSYASFRYRNYAALGVVAAICAVCSYYEMSVPNIAIAYTFIGIGCFCIIAMLFLLFLTGSERAKNIQEFTGKYDEGGCEHKIIFEEPTVLFFADGEIAEDSTKREIREIFNSPNFRIYKMASDVLIPVKKDAFLIGDLDTCINYTKPPKKKWFKL